MLPAGVRTIPEKLSEGTLYVSIDFATAAHSCCCGCEREVVTPLTPTDRKITYDGVSISLFPSVGNWSLPCRSHYWVDSGRVVWADQWSDDMIAAGRARDRAAESAYYAGQRVPPRAVQPEVHAKAPSVVSRTMTASAFKQDVEQFRGTTVTRSLLGQVPDAVPGGGWRLFSQFCDAFDI